MLTPFKTTPDLQTFCQTVSGPFSFVSAFGTQATYTPSHLRKDNGFGLCVSSAWSRDWPWIATDEAYRSLAGLPAPTFDRHT